MKGDLEEAQNDLVMSFRAVRAAVGLVGLALPFLLIAGSILVLCDLRPSISDFHNTAMRDVLVGTMCVIGVFLFAYRGYRRRSGELLSDAVLSRIAGLSAIGVALFPVRASGPPTRCGLPDDALPMFSSFTQHLIGNDAIVEGLHFAFAAVFFACLAIIALFQFTKTDNAARRAKFVACGLVIVGASAMLVVVALLGWYGSPAINEAIAEVSLVFWLESIAVIAFAISWLIKGRVPLNPMAMVSR